MVPAHERDMSVGRAEWALVPEAACLASAALAGALAIVEGLTVNLARIRENLDRLGGLLLSEPVMLGLGEAIGRGIDRLLEPAHYTGLAGEFVDDIVKAARGVSR